MFRTLPTSRLATRIGGRTKGVTPYAVRREKLRQNWPSDVDWLALCQPANVTYLSGFTGEASWLLISMERAIMVSDGRFEIQLSQECPDLEVVIRGPAESTSSRVGRTLVDLGARNVGFEPAVVTVAEFENVQEVAPSVNWRKVRGVVERLREVKDDHEIAAIRGAIQIAERSFTVVTAMLNGNQTEKELSAVIESCIRQMGGSSTSFPTIAAVGDHAALPHAPPTDRRVQESPFLLLDWGATYCLYKSDLTRVVRTAARCGLALSSIAEIESRLEKLYTVVLHGQELAIRTIRAGVPAAEVDAVVRRYFEDQGYSREFNHSLGHGIGLQIHEGPFLRLNSRDVLQAGHVVTVEPGLYIPGFGGVRIEDDVLVHPDGCEVLTHVPKEWSSCMVW